MMHRKNDRLRKKLETQEVIIEEIQDKMTDIKRQLSKCVGIITRQNFSAPIKVSVPSTPLTSPTFNSNSAYSETANFPNPSSNEDTNSDKYRRISCK